MHACSLSCILLFFYFYDLQAFPRGSPLVADVSREILNVTEGEKMKEIEKAWLGKETNCPDSNTQVSSNSLSLASFWGLFLIAGVASLLALIVSLGMFLYNERCQILMRFDTKGSLGRRIRHTLRIFDRKDLSSHTFRRRALGDRNGIDSVHVIGASEPSPDANYCPPTPLSHSTRDIGDPETPSSEYADLISRTGQVSKPAGDIEQIVHPNQKGP
jgi:ionotropic glutamate receptor